MNSFQLVPYINKNVCSGHLQFFFCYFSVAVLQGSHFMVYGLLKSEHIFKS